MNDDAQDLAQYVREGSEPAFRKLVERYLALVNATACRMTGGNVHLAQDITQLVFTDLARKAASLPRGTILGGWLHRHTCYTALKALRTENRRQKRERIAMELTALDENSGHDAHWLQLAPVLDEALNRLATRDREVIVLRYFQQQDIRRIGHDLGASETAVQKRLGRALEKLRAILTRRGVTLASATVLGSTLDAGVVTPVPTEHAATISVKAVASATATSGFLLANLMTNTTVKRIAAVVAIIIILAGLSTFFLQNRTTSAAAISSTKPIASIDKTVPKPTIVAQVEAPKLAPAMPKNDALASNSQSATLQGTNSSASNPIKLAPRAPPPPPLPAIPNNLGVVYDLDEMLLDPIYKEMNDSNNSTAKEMIEMGEGNASDPNDPLYPLISGERLFMMPSLYKNHSSENIGYKHGNIVVVIKINPDGSATLHAGSTTDFGDVLRAVAWQYHHFRIDLPDSISGSTAGNQDKLAVWKFMNQILEPMGYTFKMDNESISVTKINTGS